jgi:hypothetical protein
LDGSEPVAAVDHCDGGGKWRGQWHSYFFSGLEPEFGAESRHALNRWQDGNRQPGRHTLQLHTHTTIWFFFGCGKQRQLQRIGWD